MAGARLSKKPAAHVVLKKPAAHIVRKKPAAKHARAVMKSSKRPAAHLNAKEAPTRQELKLWKEEMRMLRNGKAYVLRRTRFKGARREAPRWVQLHVNRGSWRVAPRDHQGMARLLLRKWAMKCAPAPDASIVNDLLSVEHGAVRGQAASSVIRKVAKKLRWILKQWGVFTSGDIHYSTLNHGLLDLTTHYCRRMTSDEQRLDILDRSVFEDIFDMGSEAECDADPEYANWNSEYHDKRTTWNQEHDDNCFDSDMFGMLRE
eukprot:TRINITY_DN38908_c0_g1_i1.p1 TRINITY_DN38908_c0_g1~~TRINITY_DN38908_c0_g1_i1.p1  ORF type:complete len:280 (-),score=34.66 TRINITY_DN38908_c0_g1_i1:48-830(-)